MPLADASIGDHERVSRRAEASSSEENSHKEPITKHVSCPGCVRCGRGERSRNVAWALIEPIDGCNKLADGWENRGMPAEQQNVEPQRSQQRLAWRRIGSSERLGD